MIEQFFTDLAKSVSVSVATQHSALIVAGLSYLLLMMISRVVSRVAINTNDKNLSPHFPLKTNHASNLPDTSPLPAEQIKALSDKKDELGLALLCAVYQPTIDQLSALSRASPNPPLINYETQPNNALAHYAIPTAHTSLMNSQDLQSIRAHEKKTHKLINKDFIKRFGDLFFMENFIMYEHLCRVGNKVFYIPPNNELRKLFEMFSTTGVALRGKSIPIGERLRILDQTELQTIANNLRLDRTFNTLDQAISILAKQPQTPVHLAQRYHSEDLFLLKQENWDITAIEEEWCAYNVYAKILCGESPTPT